MFDNLSLAKKLMFGFGIVLLLLTAVGLIGYSSLGTASDGFTNYRELARDSNLMARVQANMLMVRMNVKDYILTGSDKDKQQYEDYWKKTNGFMAEAQNEINNPERAILIDKIDGELGKYHDGFEEVIDLNAKQKNLIHEAASITGPKIEQALTQILLSSKDDGDVEAAYRASMAVRKLLLARLYGSKFLSNGEHSIAEKMKNELVEMDSNLDILDRELQNPQRRALLAETKINKAEYIKAFEQIVTIRETSNNIIASTLDKIGPIIAADVEEVKLSIKRDQDKLGPELQAANNSAVNFIIALAGIAILFGVSIAYFVIRSITGPINRGVALATEIAKGDFSQRMNMTRSDEIGKLAKALDEMCEMLQNAANLAEQIAAGNLTVNVNLASEKDQLGLALQKMTSNLNDILGQIQVSSEQIASGSGQVADSSQSLSQGATEQASSLEEISASLNEMSSQTTLNAENSTQANQLAGEARKSAESGSKQMTQMVSAMGEINEAGQNISKIIKTIDEIAFQTNLLALNAAVEAARAGQHGKGFAVVAEEVRNLAARSASAAAETAELIEGSVEKTKNGSIIANQTAEALEGILLGITQVSDLVGEIAAASTEQAQGIAQTNEGVSQIDEVTQQNTAAAEESAAAAEELSGQAGTLRQMLGRFKLNQETQIQQPAIPTLVSVPGKGQWAQQEQDPAPFEEQPKIALNDDTFGRY